MTSIQDIEEFRRNSGMPALQAGDPVFSKSDGFFGKAIRWWQATADGEKSETNHVLGIIAGGPAQTAWCSEAVGHTRNVSFWRVYADMPIRVYRSRTWTLEQRLKIAAQWESAEGTGYAWLRMGPIMLDSVCGWFKRVVFRRRDDFYWFTQHAKITNFKVCSNLWAWGVEKSLGQQFGDRTWQAHTPDTLEDWMRAHPDEWELVWDTVTPPVKPDEAQIVEAELTALAVAEGLPA